MKIPPKRTAISSVPHLNPEGDGGGSGTNLSDMIVNTTPNIVDNIILAIMGKLMRPFILNADSVICTTGAMIHNNKIAKSIYISVVL
jgi:hypothetical protein